MTLSETDINNLPFLTVLTWPGIKWRRGVKQKQKRRVQLDSFFKNITLQQSVGLSTMIIIQHQNLIIIQVAEFVLWEIFQLKPNNRQNNRQKNQQRNRPNNQCHLQVVCVFVWIKFIKSKFLHYQIFKHICLRLTMQMRIFQPFSFCHSFEFFFVCVLVSSSRLYLQKRQRLYR